MSAVTAAGTKAYYLAAADRLVLRTDAFIEGRSVPAVSGERFDCISPRDGRVLTRVAAGDREDVDRAVASARAAFEDGRWSRQSPAHRREVLLRLARLVEEHAEELALLETLDMGKPITESLGVDLSETVGSFEYFAEAVNKVFDAVAPTAHDVHATITREPIGVVGAVVPWNFPLMMATWKLAPALATGNSVVLKPAEQSPLSVLRLAELAVEAGLPDGVLNVVPGFGPTAGAALGLHPDVDIIAFTGSGEVGRLFMKYSAESNMKHVSVEAGGKSPQLVFADAPDLAVVAESVAGGIFFNQGEVCSAGSRLLVHESRKDELLELVVGHAEAIRPGDPLDPDTAMGALVEELHMERVLGYIEQGRAQGAVAVTGGSRTNVESGGYYVEPTVFDEVRADMAVAQEEIFGPVLSVLTFADTDEAVRIANGTRYGLAASVWTKDLSTAMLTAKALRAGTVWVNNYDTSDVTVPFGGFRESGNGRDQSLHAMDKYTQLKSTWIQL